MIFEIPTIMLILNYSALIIFENTKVIFWDNMAK